MKILLLSLALALSSIPCFSQSQDEQRIRAILTAQEAEWNRANPAGYMKGYWEHDSLLFIGKNGPTYGFSATLERYKKAYPDARAMGILKTEILSMKRLSEAYYFVVGKWHLSRKDGDLQGSYTLLFQLIDDQWVIVADHSS
ncbi:MAG: nuclear transport factor 2 family protein [Chitinophagaceae bacterium]|nr:MAG: nuclear transport factor 2 family protein [Chitinophagaceae bacterium]